MATAEEQMAACLEQGREVVVQFSKWQRSLPSTPTGPSRPQKRRSEVIAPSGLELFVILPIGLLGRPPCPGSEHNLAA